MEKAETAVYIHIPFCKTICHYCDFCKVFYRTEFVKPYLIALKEEIKERYQGNRISSLYIGGGTPSCLSFLELKELFSILQIFHKTKNCEITFEANIDSLTEEKIHLLVENGVNRVSLGVETLNENYQQHLGRRYGKKEVEQVVLLLKKAGIYNINLDFMYGFANQTKSDLMEDLSFFLSLEVPHLSIYSLSIEDHTRLKIEKYQRLEDTQDEELFFLIEETLEKQGYFHYEVSNYAKKGYESRHNMRYWQNDTYYGFGLSSASYLDGKRTTNTRSFSHYQAGKRVIDVEVLSLYDQMEYEVMLGLRLRKGVDKERFFKRYHKKIEEVFHYQLLVEKNVLKETSSHLMLNPEYFYVLNEVLVKVLSANT